MSDLPPLNDNAISETDYEVLREINEDYPNNKVKIEEYINSKNKEFHVAPNPTVAFLTDTGVLSLLKDGLYRLLCQIEKTDSCYKPKTTLNGIDFLAEFLYNLNMKYPERRICQAHIFDMDWVKDVLEKRPRPFYPFSMIWSQDYAATKIQAFYRGYLQRKLLEVQEVRSFWKYLNEKKQKHFYGDY